MSEERDRLEKAKARMRGHLWATEEDAAASSSVLSALEAAEKELMRAAVVMGSPKDAHRLADSLGYVLASYRARGERAEAEVAALRAEVTTLKAQAMAAPVDPAAWWKLSDEADALRADRDRLERESDAMVEEAADELNRSIKAALMDEMHEHAATMVQRDRLARRALASGEESRAEEPVAPEQPKAQIIDLMEALKASLAERAEKDRAEEPGRCPHGSAGPCSVCGDQG